MTTYSITSAPGHGFHVVETFETLSWKRDGSPCYAQRVVAGPFTTRAQAQSWIEAQAASEIEPMTEAEILSAVAEMRVTV